VWSYDFVSTRTHDGRTVRVLNLIDEYTRECLMIRPERRWSSAKVIEVLADAMVKKGVPEHLRSDNGPEFVAKDLRKWLTDTGAKTLYIEPGSPWENGYCESFNSKLRDEFLNGEIFYSMKELRVLAERWRIHYNTVRPHSSLGYIPPAPEAWLTATSKGHERADAVPALDCQSCGALTPASGSVTTPTRSSARLPTSGIRRLADAWYGVPCSHPRRSVSTSSPVLLVIRFRAWQLTTARRSGHTCTNRVRDTAPPARLSGCYARAACPARK
jgi:hypothetical protein